MTLLIRRLGFRRRMVWLLSRLGPLMGTDAGKDSEAVRDGVTPRVSVPDGWVPAFPGQRPPFQPGHEINLKHGARSPRRVDPVAAELVQALLADDALAYLRQPRFVAAVQAWAKSEAKVALISEWVDGMPIEVAANSKAGSTSPLELLRRWETNAQGHRSRLGLDPVSAAKLGKDVSQGRQADAATELTKMRREAEARRSAEPGEVIDGE